MRKGLEAELAGHRAELARQDQARAMGLHCWGGDAASPRWLSVPLFAVQLTTHPPAYPPTRSLTHPLTHPHTPHATTQALRDLERAKERLAGEAAAAGAAAAAAQQELALRDAALADLQKRVAGGWVG